MAARSRGEHMAKGRAQRPQRRGEARAGARGGDSGGPGKLLLGVVLGGAAVAAGGYLYLHSAPGAAGRGSPDQAAERAGAPERKSAAPAQVAGGLPAKAPERAGIPGVHEARPPFGASEDVFEVGAGVYLQRCAKCHGTTRRDAAGPNGLRAAQLFRAARGRAAEQTPGQVFAAINLGAQGLGMPAYHGILTDQQIWQVVLLLRSAEEPLPDPVTAILDGNGR